jgi:hypothetical protein
VLDLLAGIDLGLAHLAGEENFAEQAAAVVRVAPDQQVLQHGGVLEQLDVLEGACNAQRCNFVWRLAGQRNHALRAQVSDLALGGGVDAADEVEHRGLACAVGADQGEDFALAHIEAHIVDGQHAAKAHGKVLG